MPRPRLITMPPSHFSEKARWALDRSGLDYVEEPHAPLFHRLALARVRGGTTVPALVTDDGTVRESAPILHWVDRQVPSERRLYPEEPELRQAVEEFEERLGKAIGRAVPRWLFFHILPHPRVFHSLVTRGVPPWEELALRWVGPLVRALMRRGLGLTAERADRARQYLDVQLEEAGSLLAGGKRFLFADRFTAADLTLAALYGPLLSGGHYGGSCTDLPWGIPAVAKQLTGWSATPAGEHIRRLYAEERRPLA
ncbi:MAG: glutathione S-transferase family protein [Candidatus Eremiobacterota bacterium]